MSAYQTAFEVLRRVTNDVAADEILTNLLKAHAHGLAEKIRASADEERDYYQPSGMYAAADLIDPETKEQN